MAKVWDEKRLRFAFGNSWQVEKYDDHAVYRRQIGRLSRTKAVDFVGLNSGVAFLIEAKDYRGHQIVTGRFREELAQEIALKVRDTLAGLCAGSRNATNPAWWRDTVRAVIDRGRPVNVILWLEEDMAPTPWAQKALASLQLKLLQQETHWLCARVLVVNTNSPADIPPDLTTTARV